MLENLDQRINEIRRSPKYRHLDICEDTLRDILIQEQLHNEKSSDVLKAARKKLHNVVAPYLGDPNYSEAQALLQAACQTGELEKIRQVCVQIMQKHVSTLERIPILDRLYTELFRITGKPASILDLACGLHPLSIPWMDLPSENTKYFAYDILRPRIEFLNKFLTLIKLPPFAEMRDVLVSPPTQPADVAFIFKEIHRFEQRRKGSTLALLDKLNVNYVVISLPTRSIHSKHDFTQSYKTMFMKLISTRDLPVSELGFEGEMFFIIKKGER